MGKASYIGVSSKAHKIKKAYIGVGGKARKIKKAYIGDSNGKARLWWSGLEGKFFILHTTNNTIYELPLEGNSLITHNYPSGNHYDGAYGIAYSNGKLALISGNNSSTSLFFSYTSDLVNWTEVALPSAGISNYAYRGFLSDSNNFYLLTSRYSDSEYAYLHIISSSTMTVTRSIPLGLYINSERHFGFAPDGVNLLVFGRYTSTTSRVYLIDVANGTKSEFSSNNVTYEIPARGYYNGKTILFATSSLYYCTSGKSIVLTSLQGANFNRGFIYYNDKILRCATSVSNLVMSTNFGTEVATSLSNGYGDASKSYTYGDGRYAILHGDSTASNAKLKLYTSFDGLTWTELATLSQTYITRSIIYDIPRGYGDK